jgi:hypothetical protein
MNYQYISETLYELNRNGQANQIFRRAINEGRYQSFIVI